MRNLRFLLVLLCDIFTAIFDKKIPQNQELQSQLYHQREIFKAVEKEFSILQRIGNVPKDTIIFLGTQINQLDFSNDLEVQKLLQEFRKINKEIPAQGAGIFLLN